MNVTDNMNMEYDARVMITENQYSLVLDYYQKSGKNCHKLVNLNYYYDDDKMTISNNHHVLRLRQINEDKHELTLKIKGEDGDIEYNHPLTSQEYDSLREKVLIPDSQVKDELLKLKIDLNKLVRITDLKTERLEIQNRNYLLVIDKIYFRNLFLKYHNVDGRYNKGFTIFLDGRTESARSLYRDKNNHKIIDRMIKKAEKKLNFKGTISWKKARISDFESI